MRKIISICRRTFMRRHFSLILSAVLLMGVILTGCTADTTEYTNKVYYMSTDKMSLYPVGYNYNSVDLNDCVYEAIKLLSDDVEDVKYMRPIPSDVRVDDYVIQDGTLVLYFSREYGDMDQYTELLCRAAIVKTLTQFEGIDAIAFYVNDKPLTTSEGVIVGMMTSEMFIDDFSTETDSLVPSTIVLYYASADGAYLVPQTKEVYHPSNTTLERLVVDQLLKGPDDGTLLSTIPYEAKVLSVSVTDNVCYVNFDKGFEKPLVGVTENVTVYSIVNSLTELDGVNSVEILVDGTTPVLANIDYSLADQLTRNENVLDINRPLDDTEVDIINDMTPVVR